MESGIKKLALIGCMGSGKSSLARRYAAKYGGRSFDTDREFVKRYGKIPDFFARFGEAEFRRAEEKIYIEAAESDADVIATGGGAVLSKRGMAALRRSRDIVYLYAPAEVLRARIERSDRPLKNNLEELLEARASLYEKYADYKIDSSDDSLAALEEAIKTPRGNRYDIALCDADNTLLDFNAARLYSVSEVVKKLNIPRRAEEMDAAYARIVEELWRKIERGELTHAQKDALRVKMLSEEAGVKISEQEFNSIYKNAMLSTRFTIDGAIEFLDELSARGIKPYIVTNSSTYIARERLKPLVPHVVKAFVSEEVEADKPSAKFFDKVLADIGCRNKDRIIVFGDGEGSDILGAKNAGLDCCRYAPNGAKNTSADFCVRGYKEFLDFV